MKAAGTAREWRPHRDYYSWAGMRARCYQLKHVSYPDYGGRGIRVCDRWRSFENFLADMGPKPSDKHTLDRINNDGDYEPSNCRWTTRDEQATNKRSSRRITFNGETLTLCSWARRIGIQHVTLSDRIEKWGLERALTTPPIGLRPKHGEGKWTLAILRFCADEWRLYREVVAELGVSHSFPFPYFR